MSIFSKFRGWFTGNANQQKNGSQDSTPSNTVHEDAPSVGIDGAMQVSTVWACVELLVDTISSLPLSVFSVNKDGLRESLRGTRFYSILHNSPNRRQTAMEFWQQMLFNFFLRGNAYARLVRDASGEVISAWPMSADQIDVISVSDGSMLYIYSFEEKELILIEKDVLHIRGMGNGLVGLSRLDYMRSSVGLAISTQNHTTKTLRKNARRPGILMSDVTLNADQRAAVKKNFGDIARGEDKELYLLEAKFKFDPLGMTPADIQLLESRKFSVQDLARWFGVPSVLVNDTADTTTLGSSVGEIIAGFYRLKLRPQLSLFEQAMEKRLLTPAQRSKGVQIEFNLDALLRSSLSDRMEIYSKAVQNGIKTRNECRALENDPPIEGGEILTAQSNLLPVDKLGTQTTSSGAVPPDTIKQ